MDSNPGPNGDNADWLKDRQMEKPASAGFFVTAKENYFLAASAGAATGAEAGAEAAACSVAGAGAAAGTGAAAGAAGA